MGFLILYGGLSLLALIAVLSQRAVLRVILIPSGLLALNVALFVGLLRRTRWGWWAATVTFALFAVYFAHLIVMSLLAQEPDSPAAIVSMGRVGVTGAIVFVGLYAVPFWLLVSTRRRYWAARAAKLRPDADS